MARTKAAFDDEMMSAVGEGDMSKQHIKLSIGAMVVVAAIAYLMFSGTTASTAFFVTVPELRERASTLQGEAVRVAGKVTDDPIQWDVQNLALTFTMGDATHRVPVQYKGIKPDMFQAGADVIVEGRVGQNGVLVASNLMTSCPSKYEEEDKHPTS
jgi:cytochrome c-type biogenesis protein CcmE